MVYCKKDFLDKKRKRIELEQTVSTIVIAIGIAIRHNEASSLRPVCLDGHETLRDMSWSRVKQATLLSRPRSEVNIQ